MSLPIEIQRIEQILKEKGWSKVKFAEMLGVESQHYNNWRARGLPARRQREAATILGVSIEWLIGETDDRFAIQEESAKYDHSGIDWNKFATILEAVERAIAKEKIHIDTPDLLELAEIFYEIDANKAPSSTAVIRLHDRIKKSAAGVIR